MAYTFVVQSPQKVRIRTAKAIGMIGIKKPYRPKLKRLNKRAY